MSLLREIQNATVDPNIDISVILRKCKILASRLGNEAFKSWVDKELNGYKNKNDLPDYRILNVHSQGHFTGYGGSKLNNGDIPLTCIPKEYRKGLDKSYCIQPIAAYVSLLKSSDGDNLQESWPPELVAHVGHKIYEGMNCLSAWKLIPNAGIVGLIESVRNRILNFVLEIENEAPNAGEASPSTQSVSQEKVAQVFNTTIYGNVGNMAEGSTQVNQSAEININQGDIKSLKGYLESMGIPKDEIKELEGAVSSDSSSKVTKTKTLGPKVTNWLGSISTKITQGAITIAKKISVKLITKAILVFYGI